MGIAVGIVLEIAVGIAARVSALLILLILLLILLLNRGVGVESSGRKCRRKVSNRPQVSALWAQVAVTVNGCGSERLFGSSVCIAVTAVIAVAVCMGRDSSVGIAVFVGRSDVDSSVGIAVAVDG